MTPTDFFKVLIRFENNMVKTVHKDAIFLVSLNLTGCTRHSPRGGVII